MGSQDGGRSFLLGETTENGHPALKNRRNKPRLGEAQAQTGLVVKHGPQTARALKSAAAKHAGSKPAQNAPPAGTNNGQTAVKDLVLSHVETRDEMRPTSRPNKLEERSYDAPKLPKNASLKLAQTAPKTGAKTGQMAAGDPGATLAEIPDQLRPHGCTHSNAVASNDAWP